MATGKKPMAGKGGQTPPKRTNRAKKTSTGQPRATSDARAKPKADPVVLDPPKKTAGKTKATSGPDIIEVKAVDVTKPSAADKSDGKSKTGAAQPSKPAEPKAGGQTEAARSLKGPLLGAGALFAGGAAVALGYFVAIKSLDQRPDTNREIAALDRVYKARLKKIEGRLKALEAAPKDAALKGATGDLEALKVALKDQDRALSERLAKAEAKIGQLGNTSRDADTGIVTGSSLTGIKSDITDIKQQVRIIDQGQKTLAARLDEVEKRAGEKLVAAEKKARDLAKTVEVAKSGLDMRLEVERLGAAIDLGKPYAQLMSRLAATGDQPVPETLVSSAETGISALAELQNSFPQAARQALKASIKAEAGASLGSRLTAFIKAQLGARSLEPREGDDPDAILSRAEALLKSGDLQGAVALCRQLPDSGVAAMKDWLAQAENRLSVKAAFVEFSSALAQN